jgi:hypothetical protein
VTASRAPAHMTAGAHAVMTAAHAAAAVTAAGLRAPGGHAALPGQRVTTGGAALPMTMGRGRMRTPAGVRMTTGTWRSVTGR